MEWGTAGKNTPPLAAAGSDDTVVTAVYSSPGTYKGNVVVTDAAGVSVACPTDVNAPLQVVVAPCQYTYSGWSACNGGTQTRSVFSRIPSGCNNPPPVLSQTCSLPPVATGNTIITDPLGNVTIYEFIAKALGVAVQILVPLIVIFYVITGLMFITARGAPEKLKIAKMALLYTTIGAAVVLGAWVLAQMIGDTINAIK